ncbi:hypothetical protein MasN3_03320 [Massilia varians]|uniref:Uncharacterized protein n=1 Tax=Massilia varians TaxID=457921 RepID=A0ABM8C0Z3_9BURK|nr:hypothetical protein MasN3_03320 [Massilia varians]
MALFEVRQRQFQQVGEGIAQPLQVQAGGEHRGDPGAHGADRGLQQYQQQETAAQHRDQVAVRGQQSLVHDPLHVERCDQGAHLQSQAEREQLEQAAAQADHASHQGEQGELLALFLGLELCARRQLERDAGEVLGELLHRQAPLADGRIVHDDMLGRDRLEHHEVIQIPMQDTGQLQLGQMLQVQFQRTRLQRQAAGHRHQALQAHALHRHREAAAHARDIDPVAPVACDHGHARQAAFGCFGLQQDG